MGLDFWPTWRGVNAHTQEGHRPVPCLSHAPLPWDLSLFSPSGGRCLSTHISLGLAVWLALATGSRAQRRLAVLCPGLSRLTAVSSRGTSPSHQPRA